MPYLIDGNNLLWVMLDQQDRPEHALEAGSVQLAWAVSRFLAGTGQEADLVFDGPEPLDITRYQNIPGLTVWFAGPGQQADAWIEHRLGRTRDQGSLVVVSSDRRVRQTAIRSGAAQMRSEAFWRQVQASQSQPRPAEPPCKAEGLTLTETEMWMQIFGMEQDRPGPTDG